MTLTSQQRKLILSGANVRRINMPITVISESTDAPVVCGTKWHYTTKGGKPIMYPSAYMRRGSSNMVYHPSTLRVEVGEWWISQREALAKDAYVPNIDLRHPLEVPCR